MQRATTGRRRGGGEPARADGRAPGLLREIRSSSWAEAPRELEDGRARVSYSRSVDSRPRCGPVGRRRISRPKSGPLVPEFLPCHHGEDPDERDHDDEEQDGLIYSEGREDRCEANGPHDGIERRPENAINESQPRMTFEEAVELLMEAPHLQLNVRAGRDSPPAIAKSSPHLIARIPHP